MSELPRFRTIIVEIEKVRDYCLSLSHSRGGHKARVFRARLGLTHRDAELLRTALIEAVRRKPEGLRYTENDEFGQRYLLEFEMSIYGTTAKIRSGWIIRAGEDVLRFVTAYVL